ncbi:MAG: 50S ribosomal protein L30 [Proteobacteria bacterium]|nr:50S ribosomal protein L30 [Pseudomonadota bacterium]HUT83055.1 50S ribosomal protein L30 [Thermodesulfobacteriota bacterium]
MEKQLKITLQKSYIGRPETQRLTLKSLGLHKMNRTVIVRDHPAIRGMIRKVIHLVNVEEID